MRMNMVLAVTSPSAFLKVNGTPSAVLALQCLRAIAPSIPISVAVASNNAAEVQILLKNENVNIEVLDCEPTNVHSFAAALAPMCVNIDAVMIHDASRPMTTRAQFESVLVAFDDKTDAVRPAMAFTETLKILDANSVIQKTLDRSTVHRISTPELIRVSAIDFAGSDCGWFLPLKKDVCTVQVEGYPDGLRINTVEDRDLMELNRD